MKTRLAPYRCNEAPESTTLIRRLRQTSQPLLGLPELTMVVYPSWLVVAETPQRFAFPIIFSAGAARTMDIDEST